MKRLILIALALYATDAVARPWTDQDCKELGVHVRAVAELRGYVLNGQPLTAAELAGVYREWTHECAASGKTDCLLRDREDLALFESVIRWAFAHPEKSAEELGAAFDQACAADARTNEQRRSHPQPAQPGAQNVPTVYF